MPYLTKSYKFCAAHQYWNDSWDEKENDEVFGLDTRIHGHNYQLEITVTGPVNIESGFIMNIKELNNIINDNVINVFDHSNINEDIDWFSNKQPSTENMVIYIWDQIVKKIKKPAFLYSIKLQETPTISTTYYGPDK